jgi:hypothetical protein
VNYTRTAPSRRVSSRVPLFQGRRDLKFTREEIDAIRAAEGAPGYRPHRHYATPPIDLAGLVGAVGNGPHGLGRLIGAVLLVLALSWVGELVITFALRPPSAGTQIQPPSAQSQAQTPSPRTSVPVAPPRITEVGAVASEPVDTLEAPRPAVTELQLPAARTGGTQAVYLVDAAGNLHEVPDRDPSPIVPETNPDASPEPEPPVSDPSASTPDVPATAEPLVPIEARPVSAAREEPLAEARLAPPVVERPSRWLSRPAPQARPFVRRIIPGPGPGPTMLAPRGFVIMSQPPVPRGLPLRGAPAYWRR